jgi:hypothetical protein
MGIYADRFSLNINSMVVQILEKTCTSEFFKDDILLLIC